MAELSDRELVRWDELLESGMSEREAQAVLIAASGAQPPASLLLPFIDEIQATRKVGVRLLLEDDDGAPWSSKMGARCTPYLPIDMSYPRDRETWRPLALLIQLNFEELPALAGYPATGILQIFVDAHSSHYGMNPQDKTDQSHFRVLFHEEIHHERHLLHLSDNLQGLQPPSEPEFWAIEGCRQYHDEYWHRPDAGVGAGVSCGLHGISIEQPMMDCDFRLEAHYSTELIRRFCHDIPFRKQLLALRGPHGELHQMGGYHYSSNGQDPRRDDPRFTNQDSELLVQIDGCGPIMWGDVGTACFFIRADHLARGDFSEVLYHWDCT